MNLRVAFHKKTNSFPFVPASPIHIRPDVVSGQPLPNMLQDFQESIRFTPGSSDRSLLPQRRFNPSGQVEQLAMLTCSGNPKALAFLGPASSQARIKTEASLILENHPLLVAVHPRRPEIDRICREPLPDHASTVAATPLSTGLGAPTGGLAPRNVPLSRSPREPIVRGSCGSSQTKRLSISAHGPQGGARGLGLSHGA